MKTLLDAGVISREKRSKWNYYSLNAERLAHLTQAMAEFRDQAAAA